jgi:cell division septation protein DedD
MYTVQIGAFARAANALRAQKRARAEFPGTPTSSVYLPSPRVYRVSVGRFGDRMSANRFRVQIMKKFPQEYAQCWVNYVPR